MKTVSSFRVVSTSASPASPHAEKYDVASSCMTRA
jgi:hypothetical protein